MIKKFKLYILMAAVALSATSCLDKMPEDSIPFDDAIQTVDDVNLAVIGIYDAFKNSALYSGISRYFLICRPILCMGSTEIRIHTEISGAGKTFWQQIQVSRLFMPDFTM